MSNVKYHIEARTCKEFQERIDSFDNDTMESLCCSNILWRKLPGAPFTSANEMFDLIRSGEDLYNPQLEQYVFCYNEAGVIAVYSYINLESAKKLQEKAAVGDNYWSTFLSIGGNIYDNPFEYCEDVFTNPNWISCSKLKNVFLSIEEAKLFGKNLSEHEWKSVFIYDGNNTSNKILCGTDKAYEEEIWSNIYEMLKHCIEKFDGIIDEDELTDKTSELRDDIINFIEEEMNTKFLNVNNQY